MVARQKRNSDDLLDIDSSDLEDFVGYSLKRAYMILQEDFRAALGEGSMSPRVFSALSLVVQFPNITQSELARMLGIERSGLVAMVDELEAKKFIKRAPVPGDRRVQALVPLAAGQSAYADALVKVKEHEAVLLKHITAEERRMLMTLLKKIRQDEGL